MNVNSINNTYTQPQINNQAKLPTGAAAKETVKAFEKVISSFAQPMSSTDVSKTMNGISEGISQVEEQLKADAQAAKSNLKALFNKLSGAEAVKLDEDGFDINDIDDEELVTVVDRIKIMLKAYNENYQAFAGAFDVEGSKELEGGAGNLAAKVAAKLNEGYMPATEDNVTEVASAVEMAQDTAEKMPLTEEAKAYLIDNSLEPTLDNVYKANHSTIHNGYQAGLTNDQWEQIKPQVKELVQKSEIEESDKVYEDAKWLIARELPVTAENLLMKDALDGLEFAFDEEKVMNAAISSMASGNKAAQIYLTDSVNANDDAAKAIEIVNSVSYENVENIIITGRKLTIDEMARELLSKNGVGGSHKAEQVTGSSAVTGVLSDTAATNRTVVSSYRVLCEARILMTASNTVSIINKGIDIYSQDLHNLVELLREEETKFINEQLTKAGREKVSESDLAVVSNTNNALLAMKFMPCAAIGRVVSVEAGLTVTKVWETGFNMQRQYEQAGQSYETMSTKVRSDMGDSIKEAMKNSGDSILEELGYESNEINLRAVRILAYNNMEMTESNFLGVRSVDSILNKLMDNMSPQIVYDMIKDGINPMETDIATLNRYINENYQVQEGSVKYSEFLYKLEQDDQITEEERSQYIGIYKMFHMFRKDGGKAVGALINQNAEINMKNLVMAVRSRRSYNMDVTLDVDAGMASVSGEVMYYENLFSELSKSITPSGLKKAAQEFGDLENISPEKMTEYLEEGKKEDAEIKQEYYAEVLEETRMCQDVEESVMRMLTDNSLPVTFYNVMAAQELAEGSKIYRDLYEIKKKDVEGALDNIFEALDSEEAMNEAFEKLEKSVKDADASMMSEERTDTYLDVRAMKYMSKTVSLMSSLGKHQQYFIPFAGENGIGGINLKVIKTEENAGRMQMEFSNEVLGNVYVEMNVTMEKASGYIVNSHSESVDLINEAVDNITQKLSEMGITEVDIRTGTANETPKVGLADNETGAPAAFIYKTAKKVLENLLSVRSE